MKHTGILMMPDMKCLHLTLNRRWFDLIASGEKKEEYRELKEYWANRLIWDQFSWDFKNWQSHIAAAPDLFFNHFDTIVFKNGYSKKSPIMEVEFNGIRIGKGQSKWGAPDCDVFIISLGNILTLNY